MAGDAVVKVLANVRWKWFSGARCPVHGPFEQHNQIGGGRFMRGRWIERPIRNAKVRAGRLPSLAGRFVDAL